MRSPSYYENEATSVRYVAVEPAEPSFYTRIISYSDVKTALDQETQPTGLAADPTSRPLIVSDVPLLNSILAYNSSQKSDATVSTSWKHRRMLSLTRPSSTLSFMDNFVLLSSSSNLAVYVASSLQLSIARMMAFNSLTLLGIYVFALRWLALECLERILSSTGLDSYPEWAFLASTVFAYSLVLKGLGVMQKWILQ
jgi:uncharacterized PurR-regulated membrane protein YhhQ (DUF165 family)